MSQELTLIQRYGFRTIIILILLFVFSTFLLFEYIITGYVHTTILILSILFYFITAVLLVGFSLTRVKKINKSYFTMDSLIGKTGKVIKACKPGEKGSATVASEDWSIESDEELFEGDTIVVIGVLEDKITLIVKKI
jgi:membrane-bound ClpP family serine protease